MENTRLKRFDRGKIASKVGTTPAYVSIVIQRFKKGHRFESVKPKKIIKLYLKITNQ